MKRNKNFIDFFRQASPYIHLHRGKTFVFCIQDSETTEKHIQSVLHDIAILHSLGVKIIIVFGARWTINKHLKNQKIINDKRVTDSKSIEKIKQIVGLMQIKIESILSMGLANTPMQGASINTCSGNFIIAKPLGIINGVDFGLSGSIRNIRTEAIKQKLEQGDIVLISPIGFSTTGEIFNLTTEEVATKVADNLFADKLMFLNDDIKDLTAGQNDGKSLTINQAKQIKTSNIMLQTTLSNATSTHNVKRTHLVPKDIDGAIISELFTRDGFGLMITDEAYDRIEKATVNDIPSLLELIRPLEKKGILVRRSRELLEMEIEHFILLKRDNSIIGCAALYPYKDNKNIAELGCLVVSPDYQKRGLADSLLEQIEKKANKQNIKQIFCLTTNTSHWFAERGFKEIQISDLPMKKQELYNHKRNSKPYLKVL